MSGTIRFDDEHIVRFTIDTSNPESPTMYMDIIWEGDTYSKEVPVFDLG